jgi:two-component system sensor histidine kinase MprB
MTFRTRLAVLSAGAVAIAVALIAIAVFLVARNILLDQVDEDLKRLVSDVTRQIEPGETPLEILLPRTPLGEIRGYAQLISADGGVVAWTTPMDPAIGTAAIGRPLLPVGEKAIAVAAGKTPPYFADMQVGNVHTRVYTQQVTDGLALQVARPLDEVDRNLRRLSFLLAVAGLGGIVLAALAGGFVARTAMRPVKKMTETAESVAETQDLTQRIEATGHDELSRLASSFNQMLEALEGSLGEQRQLVADASHELRTPITSARTNIEVLQRSSSMPDEERQQLLSDVVDQLEELTVLVNDLVELARGSELSADVEQLRLDEVALNAVERARRQHPDVTFDLDAEPTTVEGTNVELERAIGNLLDNAAKWTNSEGRVDVKVMPGILEVRDWGPGVAEEDLPHIFQRFYRSPSSRGLPGSGLGLAIVKQAADRLGGWVEVENAPGGGALFRMHLPNGTDD